MRLTVLNVVTMDKSASVSWNRSDKGEILNLIEPPLRQGIAIRWGGFYLSPGHEIAVFQVALHDDIRLGQFAFMVCHVHLGESLADDRRLRNMYICRPEK